MLNQWVWGYPVRSQVIAIEDNFTNHVTEQGSKLQDNSQRVVNDCVPEMCSGVTWYWFI